MTPKKPPTAIFCANDLMAVGCYEALRELGLKIPDNIAVMGYDDREIAQHLHPPLTTVLLPHFDMGSIAAEILFDAVRLSGYRFASQSSPTPEWGASDRTSQSQLSEVARPRNHLYRTTLPIRKRRFRSCVFSVWRQRHLRQLRPLGLRRRDSVLQPIRTETL